jgi:hypothetical protein
MKITCADRERIFLDGSEEEWLALEAHAAECAGCQEEVRAWKSLSTAAEELRDYTESPGLWSKVEAALVQQSGKRNFWPRLDFWRPVPMGWQTALAGAMVLVLAVLGGYMYLQHAVEHIEASDSLLQNRALAEVERTERDYRKAIDKLAGEAKPQLQASSSPLIASYREKLLVLDSAISQLRSEAGENPSNAQLRRQLLAMYQEKQETLEEILETNK